MHQCAVSRQVKNSYNSSNNNNSRVHASHQGGHFDDTNVCTQSSGRPPLCHNRVRLPAATDKLGPTYSTESLVCSYQACLGHKISQNRYAGLKVRKTHGKNSMEPASGGSVLRFSVTGWVGAAEPPSILCFTCCVKEYLLQSEINQTVPFNSGTKPNQTEPKPNQNRVHSSTHHRMGV